MKLKRIFILAVSIQVLCVIATFAQDTLDVSDAIRIGLEHNFSIRVAENSARIAVNNNSLGNAGFLPSASASGSKSWSNQDTDTQRFDFATGNPGPHTVIKDGESSRYEYGISAGWTIFDGLTMFAAAKRLSIEEDIGNAASRLSIENVIADIVDVYYSIVGQQQAYHVLENTVAVSEERIRIAETKKDLGSGSDYDLLQARADFNEDRAALIRAGTALNQRKVNINRLLSDTTFADFNVKSAIEIGNKLDLDALLKHARAQNTEMTLARLNQNAAKERFNETLGSWLPRVGLNAGYSHSQTVSSSGFSAFSDAKGINYGITASINLFDGFNRRRVRQNAQINFKNEQIRLQDTELNITAQILQTYAVYQDALSLIELEQENLVYNRQTQDIALERFRLGTISSIELRETQQSLLSAENRLILAQIEAKNAETELLRLSGLLLQKG